MILHVYHRWFHRLASQLQLPGLAPRWTVGSGSMEAIILCLTVSPVPRRICLVKTRRMNERRVQPCLERCFLPPALDFLYVGVHACAYVWGQGG